MGTIQMKKVHVAVLICVLPLFVIFIAHIESITIPIKSAESTKINRTASSSASYSHNITLIVAVKEKKHAARQNVSSPSASATSTPSTANEINDKNNLINTTKLPLMIIHIGPRKTATTSIQSAFYKNSKDLLPKDSFTFISSSMACTGTSLFVDPKNCKTTIHEFQNRLEKLRLSNMNVILSSEKVARKLLNETNALLLKQITKDWNVRIVGTYRRYFDWLLSEYDQQAKRNQGYQPGMKTLVKFYDMFENDILYGPLDTLLVNTIKRHFNKLYIFNMHGDEVVQNDATSDSSALSNSTSNDLVTRFICEAIPEAEHTCKTLMSDHARPLNSHANVKEERIPIEALLVTVALKEQKVVQFDKNDAETYFKIADKVNEYLLNAYDNNDTNTNILRSYRKEKPLSCLSKESIDEIHNRSIAIEKFTLPKFHQSAYGAPVLKSLFAKFVKEKKFCQLDVATFLHREKDNLLLHIKPAINLTF